MRKCLIILTLMTMLASCKDAQHPKFRVINNSGSEIDSIFIQPNRDTVYVELGIGDSLLYVSNMSGPGKTDGSYSIRWRNKITNKKFREYFGYYTNGMPLDDSFRINILSDTINIVSYINKY